MIIECLYFRAYRKTQNEYKWENVGKLDILVKNRTNIYKIKQQSMLTTILLCLQVHVYLNLCLPSTPGQDCAMASDSLCFMLCQFVPWRLIWRSCYFLWHFFLPSFPNFSGRGPLKSTMGVIKAAKRIAENGSKLDKLARTIADQVSFWSWWKCVYSPVKCRSCNGFYRSKRTL